MTMMPQKLKLAGQQYVVLTKTDYEELLDRIHDKEDMPIIQAARAEANRKGTKPLETVLTELESRHELSRSARPARRAAIA